MQRERTGKGCRVETNMMTACMAFMNFWFVDHYSSKALPDMCYKSRVSQAFAFSTSDRKLLSIHLSSAQKFWDGLLTAIDAPQLATDPRFAARPDRITNYDSLRAELGAIFSRKSRDEWAAILLAHDVPFAPIYTFDEPAQDPQVKYLDLFFELEHAGEDSTVMVKRPVWIDGKNGSEDSFAPPVLGEHTGEVLKNAGYSDVEIQALRKAGAVG